jgi:hypothetical protein
MNKKLIYTSIWLCLGGLTLSQSSWAKSDNANTQSMKHCPKEYLKDPSALVLTKKMPNTRFDDNGTPDNFTDDSYERCNKDFSECEFVVEDGPVPGQIIIGSNGANNIEGTPGDDIICGNNGNDIIDGREGNDEIHGNNGSDDLFGGLGDDTLHGGNGSDYLSGYDDDNDDLNDAELDDHDPETDDSDEDWLEGGNGKDDLFGGPDDDKLLGENGKDNLNGGDGFDAVDGGNGKDQCTDIDDNHDDDHFDDEDAAECSVTEIEDEHGSNHS